MNMSWILIAVLTFLVVLVVLSYIVEALRSAPKRPETFVWAPRISIEYVDLDGIRVRCIKTGAGPNTRSPAYAQNPARHIRENHSRAREALHGPCL
jgi:hypothetical protein